MNRFFSLLGLLTLALVLSTFGVRAEDLVITPVASAVVPEGTDVIIPWGAWLSDLASTIGTLLFGVVIYGLRKLPAYIVAILQAEQLLQKTIDYGMNATADASKGRTLSVNVANSVIAQAVTYAVENGAPTVIRWLDGPEGVSKKVLAGSRSRLKHRRS